MASADQASPRSPDPGFGADLLSAGVLAVAIGGRSVWTGLTLTIQPEPLRGNPLAASEWGKYFDDLLILQEYGPGCLVTWLLPVDQERRPREYGGKTAVVASVTGDEGGDGGSQSVRIYGFLIGASSLLGSCPVTDLYHGH